jgi:hypothetical protein
MQPHPYQHQADRFAVQRSHAVATTGRHEDAVDVYHTGQYTRQKSGLLPVRHTSRTLLAANHPAVRSFMHHDGTAHDVFAPPEPLMRPYSAPGDAGVQRVTLDGHQRPAYVGGFSPMAYANGSAPPPPTPASPYGIGAGKYVGDFYGRRPPPEHPQPGYLVHFDQPRQQQQQQQPIPRSPHGGAQYDCIVPMPAAAAAAAAAARTAARTAARCTSGTRATTRVARPRRSSHFEL